MDYPRLSRLSRIPEECRQLVMPAAHCVASRGLAGSAGGGELGQLVTDDDGVGVAGAQDTGAVGDHLAVEFLGLGPAALAGGEPGQGGARGQGVGMVVAEEPAPV